MYRTVNIPVPPHVLFNFIIQIIHVFTGPMLTNEQIQGITILVGSISVVFVFLVTILFAVFCYYKKKRDEWHYKSYGTAGDVSKFNPDFKSIAASMHYSSHYNTSPSSYGTTLTPNQYLLSDINDNFNPNMEYSPFHAAVNLAAAEHDRLKGNKCPIFVGIIFCHLTKYTVPTSVN